MAFRDRLQRAKHKDLIKILQDHLRVEVTCDLDYLGTPYVDVSLWVGTERIATSNAAIPEHSYDPDW